MSSHVAFDTLAYSNKLKEAGMEPRLAEVQAKINADVFSNIIEDQVATKKDIAELRYETKKDIAELRSETKKDIADVKKDIGNLRTEVREEMKDLELRLLKSVSSIVMGSLFLLSTIFAFLQHFMAK